MKDLEGIFRQLQPLSSHNVTIRHHPITASTHTYPSLLTFHHTNHLLASYRVTRTYVPSRLRTHRRAFAMLRLVALAALATAHVQALTCITIGEEQQDWCVAAAFAPSCPATSTPTPPHVRASCPANKWPRASGAATPHLAPLSPHLAPLTPRDDRDAATRLLLVVASLYTAHQVRCTAMKPPTPRTPHPACPSPPARILLPPLTIIPHRVVVLPNA